MEKKGHRNLRACVRIHVYAYVCSSSACACFMHAYAYMGMRMHATVLETTKDKFSAFKTWFGTNPTSFGSHSKPLFSDYKKPYMVLFQNTQKIRRENTRFTKNNELKKEFFKKHPQINIFLIETFFGLDLRVSRFN